MLGLCIKKIFSRNFFGRCKKKFVSSLSIVMSSMKKTASTPLPPGNMGLPFFGEFFSFARDFQKFATERHQKFGKIFKTQIFGQQFIYLYGQEATRFVLSNENTYFANSSLPNSKKLLGSMSLSWQKNPEHKNRRQILTQLFQPSALKEYVNMIDEITKHYLENWQDIQTFAWYPELQNYTFDIACKLLIGLDFASSTELRYLFEVLGDGFFSFSPAFPWTKLGRALHSRQKLLTYIEKIIHQRRQSNELGSDALGILLQAKDDNGQSLSLEEIKDQLLTLLFAGHSTLTSALASFCLLTAQHDEVLSHLIAEQEQIGTSKPLNMEELKQMTYLEQVLTEILRTIPPVGAVFRTVIKECNFNGYRFPKGWNVTCEINFTHQDSDIYKTPEQFLPERFSSERLSSSTRRNGYIPFGGGVRECLGKEFARLEMKIFAVRLLRGYSWRLLSNQDLTLEMIPVPRPRDGLKVSLKKQ